MGCLRGPHRPDDIWPPPCNPHCCRWSWATPSIHGRCRKLIHLCHDTPGNTSNTHAAFPIRQGIPGETNGLGSTVCWSSPTCHHSDLQNFIPTDWHWFICGDWVFVFAYKPYGNDSCLVPAFSIREGVCHVGSTPHCMHNLCCNWIQLVFRWFCRKVINIHKAQQDTGQGEYQPFGCKPQEILHMCEIFHYHRPGVAVVEFVFDVHQGTLEAISACMVFWHNVYYMY